MNGDRERIVLTLRKLDLLNGDQIVELDSLSLTDLILALEADFHISLPMDAFYGEHLISVDALVDRFRQLHTTSA